MKPLLKKLKKGSKSFIANHKKQDKKSKASEPFPFFNLPREIRDLIYGYIFGHEAVHLITEVPNFTIENPETPVTHLRCRFKTPSAASDCCPWIKPLDLGVYEILTSDADKNMDISILYACKQTYTEASAILYSSLTFHSDKLETWNQFAATIRPEHLASIKSLRASWIALACLTEAPVPPEVESRYPKYENYTTFSDGAFQDFWNLAATKMHSLVDLGFIMEYTGHYLSRSTTAVWVESLTKVKGLKNVELEIWDIPVGSPSRPPRSVEEADKANKEMDVLVEYLKGQMCSGKSTANAVNT